MGQRASFPAGKVKEQVARRRKRQLQRVVLGAILLVVLTSLVTYAVFGSGPAGLAADNDPRIAKLWGLVRLVQEQYVEGPVDTQKLIEGAYEGVIRALGDAHSNYLTKEAYQEWMIDIGGHYAGVGMTIMEGEDGGVRVVRPFLGSPAEKAGLKSGDRITKIDDRDVTGLSSDEVANLVRGKPGTPVKITVERQEAGRVRTIETQVVRANIQVPAVEEATVLPGGIGYILLTNFNENAYEQMASAIKNLNRQGMRGLILDLRHNGGGALDQAVKVAGLFVPQGVVVSVAGRDGKREEYRSQGPGFGRPLVLLVDGYTASASEIVAGAVRDYGVGSLVGTRTFGKGSVQQLFPLPDGSGVRLTVAKYYTPRGTSIDKVGLQPDAEVALPAGKLPTAPAGGREIDAQVQKAIDLLKDALRTQAAAG